MSPALGRAAFPRDRRLDPPRFGAAGFRHAAVGERQGRDRCERQRVDRRGPRRAQRMDRRQRLRRAQRSRAHARGGATAGYRPGAVGACSRCGRAGLRWDARRQYARDRPDRRGEDREQGQAEPASDDRLRVSGRSSAGPQRYDRAASAIRNEGVRSSPSDLGQNARSTPPRGTHQTMKRLAVAFVALLSLPFAAPAWSADALDGRLKKIRDSKSIGIAYRTDASPFSFEENQQVTGYSIDLCRRVVGAIERQLGISELKIRWVPVTSQTRFDAVAKGQADMECGASTVTLERMKTVDFSSFIFIDGTGLLVKASLSANALTDLGGKKIGVISGTSNERALNEAMKRNVINATVVPVKSREAALEQLEGGAIDAFASD